jgi:hypothetical protein
MFDELFSGCVMFVWGNDVRSTGIASAPSAELE